MSTGQQLTLFDLPAIGPIEQYAITPKQRKKHARKAVAKAPLVATEEKERHEAPENVEARERYDAGDMVGMVPSSEAPLPPAPKKRGRKQKKPRPPTVAEAQAEVLRSAQIAPAVEERMRQADEANCEPGTVLCPKCKGPCSFGPVTCNDKPTGGPVYYCSACDLVGEPIEADDAAEPTHEIVLRVLTRTLGAENRWTSLRCVCVADEELTQRISFEIGGTGGTCWDGRHVYWKDGDHPSIQVEQGKPLKGPALLAKVRAIFGIRVKEDGDQCQSQQPVPSVSTAPNANS